MLALDVKGCAGRTRLQPFSRQPQEWSPPTSPPSTIQDSIHPHFFVGTWCYLIPFVWAAMPGSVAALGVELFTCKIEGTVALPVGVWDAANIVDCRCVSQRNRCRFGLEHSLQEGHFSARVQPVARSRHALGMTQRIKPPWPRRRSYVKALILSWR